MTQYEQHYEDLVKILVYNHGHSDAKKRQVVMQKKLMDGLDFDEAGNLIEEASDNLSFVCALNGKVWYRQTEDALVYIRDDTDMMLQMLSDKFDHLKPPELRERFNL